MKTLQLVVLGVLLNMISGSPLLAQCAGGTTPVTITYDTIVTGNGNNSYSLTFPKFDPSLGTFLSVNFQSVVNLSYSYTLQNHEVVPVTFKTRTLRDDDISAPEFNGADISQSHQTNQIVNVLAGNQSLVYGPAHFGYTVKDSINNGSLINFEGVGNVTYDYEQATGYNLSTSGGTGNVNVNFNYVHDTTEFMVIYKFCPNALLSSDLLFFTAVPQSKDNVLLNWRQASVQPGRMYTVQYSRDGVTFNSLADVAENTAGAYNYNYLNGSAKKLFFRILEKNVSGEVKYSNVRTVEFNQDIKGSVQVFPTLYHAGNLQVNFPEKGDWQITLFAADGRKLTQSRHQQASAVLFAVPASLGNGIYIIQSLNTYTQQVQNTRIVVQR